MSGQGGGWEGAVLYRIAGRPPNHLGIVKAVTALGSRPAAYTITLGSAFALSRNTRSPAARTVTRLLGALGAADLAREALCRAVARPRPPRKLQHGHYTGFSFPSRHATLAALTAYAVIAAAPAGRRAPVAAASLTACLAVGASRLRLGVHWPTDVAAGYLFAAAFAIIAQALDPLPAPPASQYH